MPPPKTKTPTRPRLIVRSVAAVLANPAICKNKEEKYVDFSNVPGLFI
jgi:hypothetical protein